MFEIALKQIPNDDYRLIIKFDGTLSSEHNNVLNFFLTVKLQSTAYTFMDTVLDQEKTVNYYFKLLNPFLCHPIGYFTQFTINYITEQDK